MISNLIPFNCVATPCNESKLPKQKAAISRLFGVVQNPWNWWPNHSGSCSKNCIFWKFWKFSWFFFVRTFWVVSWVWETPGGGAPKSSILSVRSVYFSLHIFTMFGVHASLWLPYPCARMESLSHLCVKSHPVFQRQQFHSWAVIRMRGRQTSWKCAVKSTRSEPIISMV